MTASLGSYADMQTPLMKIQKYPGCGMRSECFRERSGEGEGG